MKVKCDCGQKDCPKPEYELEVWVRFEKETMLPVSATSAYYEGDTPAELTSPRYFWLKMKESK